MSRKVFLTLPLALILAVGSASAATIDPGLQQVLQNKAGGELVDVMMLMDSHADLASLDASLTQATPQQRRQAVMAALRQYAAGSQSSALALLNDAERAGQARNIRSLWLANAIAFRAERSVVESLAASKDQAVLIHDKPYAMIADVNAPVSSAVDGSGSGDLLPGAQARTDTVWGVKWIRANRVWLDTGYMGSGVVVGHFDTGVWLTHPDIVNRLWVNPGEIPGNLIDDDNNGYVDDVHGYDFADQDSDPNDDVVGGASNHGTHTAGTVAGDGTNGTITGVAPRASIMVCKSYNSDGSGAPFSAIYEGQQYAIMMGAQVFTMSLGIGGSLPASLMRTERVVGDGIRAAGVSFFNAAGNDHGTYTPPDELGVTARVPAPWNPIASTRYSSRGGVMAVGGTGYRSNATYSISSHGPADWGDVSPWNDWPYNPGTGLTKPDVVGPAVGVNSLQKPNGYSGDTWSGTSMACPHAAGVAALLLSKNPTLSPAGVDSILEQTAIDLGLAGKDNTYGAGELDALAAINAVPTTQLPHLVETAAMLDPGGDGILDPGEMVDLTFELTNNSQTIAASGVTAGLAVVANPYVTVVDGSGTFGNIPAGGGTAVNSGDVFRVSSTAGALQGFTFTALLTVYAQNGYQKTFDIKLKVGLPDYLTHDAGGVYLTVTDQGIIGYMDDSQALGDGFGAVGGGSELFVGSLWAGTDQNYICNRDYHGTGGGTETYEWELVESPNGRVKDLGAGFADQQYEAIFSDTGAASPKPVVVTQRSYAWAGAPKDQFIVVRYTIRNDGATTINDYHVGIFCDLDIGDAASNEGNVDASRNLTYMYYAGGSYDGIQLLDHTPAKNLTLINNPTYVYPNQAIDNSIKSRYLKALLSTPSSSAPDDWSALTSAGPFSLAPGAEVTVTFALLHAASLAELQTIADAAAALTFPTAISELTPLPNFNLAQNEPNPFNPSTNISFSVDREGLVRLAIFDLSGRMVRSLVNQDYAAGTHTVTWDGKDDSGAQMPSGLYVYRYESGGKSVSRKMTLVK